MVRERKEMKEKEQCEEGKLWEPETFARTVQQSPISGLCQLARGERYAIARSELIRVERKIGCLKKIHLNPGIDQRN